MYFPQVCTSFSFFCCITALRLVSKQSELNAKERREYGMKALERADVICCTLNYSGSAQMSNFFGTNSAVNPRGRCPLAAVIVDEVSEFTNLPMLLNDVTPLQAGQSIELDNLIPFKYSLTKLVLVGDQEQLPPTVLCKVSVASSNHNAWRYIMYVHSESGRAEFWPVLV